MEKNGEDWAWMAKQQDSHAKRSVIIPFIVNSTAGCWAARIQVRDKSDPESLMTWKSKRQRTAAPGCRFAGNKRCTWVLLQWVRTTILVYLLRA